MTKLRETVEKQGTEVKDSDALLKAKEVEEITLSGVPFRRALEEIRKTEVDKGV